MKTINPIAQAITIESGSNARHHLSELEREVQRLKDYIFGLKLMVALMAGCMAVWFTVDVVFRAVGWFRS